MYQALSPPLEGPGYEVVRVSSISHNLRNLHSIILEFYKGVVSGHALHGRTMPQFDH